MPNLTAAEIFQANKGVGPGFDALRLGLSVWVFTLHSAYICQGAEGVRQLANNPIHKFIVTPVLPKFFLVSGYLITGSAIRTRSLSTFLLFRIFRILPALFVEVTLSAVVLGPWLTEKSLAEYFSDPLFYKYFLNIVGRVHLYLPGLFLQNPIPFANASLWTLKPEFHFYRLGRFAFVLPIVLGLAVIAAFSAFGLGNWLDATFNGGCLRAVPSFVAGMVVHRLATRELAGFRAPVWLAHGMAVGTIALLLAGAPGALVLVYMAALVFVMVAAEPERPGVLSGPWARRLASASYGFYLLHIPVADVLLRSLPHHFRWPPMATYALAPVALGVTTVLAIVSFPYFEKPLRRYLGAPLRRPSALLSFSDSLKQPFRDAH